MTGVKRGDTRRATTQGTTTKTVERMRGVLERMEAGSPYAVEREELIDLYYGLAMEADPHEVAVCPAHHHTPIGRG
jgi:hypothetical protein